MLLVCPQKYLHVANIHNSFLDEKVYTILAGKWYLNSEHLLALVGNVGGGAVPWHCSLPDLLGSFMAGSHLVRGLWGERRGRDRGPRPVLFLCILYPLEKVRPATCRSVQGCEGVCRSVQRYSRPNHKA